MIRRPIKRATAILLGIVSIVVLLLGYTWLSHRQHQENPKDTTIPSWSQLKEGVVKAFSYDRYDKERWIVADAKATGTRFFLGLGVSVVCAVIIGLLMGCFAPVEAFCYPPLTLSAKIPPTAAMAVFFVLVGTDLNMYVAMIAFGIVPTLGLTAYLAVKEFPNELQYKAYTLGASHVEVIWTIIFRQVLPRLIDGVRLMIGPVMVFLIAAEMLVGDVGFGYRIRLQSKLLNMSVVYPYLALLAAFGFGMDYAMQLVQRWWSPWFEKKQG